MLILAGNYNKARKSSDMTLLMTNTGNACGMAYFDSISSGMNLGVVKKSCATGYYSLGHEIAHMYGPTYGPTHSVPLPCLRGFTCKVMDFHSMSTGRLIITISEHA